MHGTILRGVVPPKLLMYGTILAVVFGTGVGGQRDGGGKQTALWWRGSPALR